MDIAESSGARILDIPAFKGTRKALSPDRKRQVADFVKYVERTKKYVPECFSITTSACSLLLLSVVLRMLYQ